MMRICFISYSYPNKFIVSDFVFVKQLVEAIASLGHHCQVVAPFSLTHHHHFIRRVEEYTCGKGCVTVYRPSYLSFSTFHIGSFYPSEWLHKRSIKKGLRMLDGKPDVLYGHFWSEGYYAYKFAKHYRIPIFVASGESQIEMGFIPQKDLSAFREYVCGVICVSGKNRDESIKLGLTSIDKCEVFPNAVNSNLFYKRNKDECRKQLGISLNAFVVVFVGWFNERKGPMRVAKALEMIKGVNSLFIGKGDQDPQCDGILFKGALPHEIIPLYLNAADVFVLPTLHEGCCNAVIEAMACGLPIISSNRSFNWDVLDDSNSIMVDPESIDEISNAIRYLRDNPVQRETMSLASTRRAERLTIEQRAKAIISFIETKMMSTYPLF